MKNVFVITLLSFLFFACQNNTGGDQAKEESTTEEPGQDHSGHDHAKLGAPTPASASAPMIGVWRVQNAIMEAEKYNNRWIDFKNDGTCDMGKDGKVIASGNWAFDGNTELIDLTFADAALNEQWRVQRHNDGLIFMGNTPKNPKGNQMRYEKLEERPE